MQSASVVEKRSTILIVDDTPDNVLLISSLLSKRYRTKAATSGEKALEICASDDPPDLILLDIMMAGMDGFEVCRRIKTFPRVADTPVIFLTAKTDAEDEQKGFELGGVDYITKPISPAILGARVRTHLELKAAKDFLKSKNDYLEKEVARRTQEIAVIQDVTIAALGSLAETRDNETGNHIRRTQIYIRVLADQMKSHPRFRDHLSEEKISLLYKSAPLHDIGKVGIPDAILLKPDKLTPEEFEIMKTHTTLGRDSILAAERLLDTPDSFLATAREIAWTHHERWNGSGYPQGLSGDGIPVSGRLMAVVDVYDALMSKRVYKPAFPHEKSVSIIEGGIGTDFDPDIVSGFLKVSEDLREIAQSYVDRSGS